MTKTILAFDELDKTLGHFFYACKQDLDTFLNKEKISSIQLGSSKLNDLAISYVTNGHSSFIFGAYSHGSHDCLVEAAKNIYISIPANGKSFKNSFFYTWSCSSGKKLGVELIELGCLCFIGYNKEVAIWNSFIKPFVSTANFGLIEFYKGKNSNDVFIGMKQNYNVEIDSIYNTDYIIASILRENRDALVLHGENISINNLTL